MKRKGIIFTEKNKAEYLDMESVTIKDDQVLVKTEYTALSGGTERASITAMPNTNINSCGDSHSFPIMLGYSGIGIILETGKSIKKFIAGDRVLIYHGVHSNYNIVYEDQLTKVPYSNIDSIEACFVPIASMSLGGVRKTKIEPGESAMVFGMGILGAFSVEFFRYAGGLPIIVADLNPARRKMAIEIGADFVFDPADANFKEQIRHVTEGKGINAIVEVTGSSLALKQALDIAAYMGRLSLLGCTRISDCSIDYYQKVHRPGITLIGAHNFVRPKYESYPYHWTHHDDCHAILKMLSMGRLSFKRIITEIANPQNASDIYNRLISDPEFPVGFVFDWISSGNDI